MSIDRQHLVKIVDHIGINNPELSDGIRKWIPFLSNSINKISFITKRSSHDILQQILVGVSEINMIYNVPLYRFRGRLYEKLQESGDIVKLATPRNNKSKKVQFWVQKDEIEKIKKAKLESTVYREIGQQVTDILSAHFTQRNGYKKDVKGEEFVVVRSDKDRLRLSKKEVHSVEKTVEIVGLDKLDKQVDATLEDEVVFNNYVSLIKDNVSDTVSRVLDVMIADPNASVNSVAEYLGLNIDTVILAKCEIIRNIPFEFDDLEKKNNTNRKPIYLTVE